MSQRGRVGQCEQVLGDVRCGRATDANGTHPGRCSARVNMEWYRAGEHTQFTNGLTQFVTYIGYGSRRIRSLIKEVRL
jgi:hypothetical protein